MAGISFLPAEAFSVTCVNNATLYSMGVSAGTFAIYDNTKEVLLYNMDITNYAFVRFGDPAVITLPGHLTLANSTVIPPGMSVHFAIGPLGERQVLGAHPVTGTTYQNMFIRSNGGLNVIVNITYVQCRGYTGPM